jgi:integrase/recombinase XerD
MNSIQPYESQDIIDCEIISDTNSLAILPVGNNETAKEQLRNELFGVTIISTEKAIALWVNSQNSQNTKKVYQRNINQFFKWFDYPYEKITPAMLGNYKGWLQYLYSSQNTQSTKLNSVKSFFSYLVKSQHLLFNPTQVSKNIPGVNAINQRIVEKSEIKELLKVTPEYLTRVVKILATSGARISELTNAVLINDNGTKNYHQLPSGNYALTVTGKGNKSRGIEIDKECFEYLVSHSQNNLLIHHNGFKYNYHQLYKALKKSVKKAGLNHNISFHWLRHYFATSALASGIGIKELQKALGHSSPATSLIYSEINEQNTVYVSI